MPIAVTRSTPAEMRSWRVPAPSRATTIWPHATFVEWQTNDPCLLPLARRCAVDLQPTIVLFEADTAATSRDGPGTGRLRRAGRTGDPTEVDGIFGQVVIGQIGR